MDAILMGRSSFCVSSVPALRAQPTRFGRDDGRTGFVAGSHSGPARFAKPPRSDYDGHRSLRADESLERALTWREARRLTKALTVQYDRVLYLLEDTDANRALIH